MNIHVGNLSYTVTEEDLRKEFEAFGHVSSVNIVKDKRSGQSKGFAFIEMPAKSDGTAAIASLHRKILADRTLDVTESQSSSGKRTGGSFGGRGSRRRRGR